MYNVTNQFASGISGGQNSSLALLQHSKNNTKAPPEV